MRKLLGPNLTDFSDAIADEFHDTRELINGDHKTLDLLDTVDKQNLVAALNEVLQIAKTAVSLEAIDTVVQDYFVLHPQSFVYDQIIPSLNWLITHPLDHKPSVTITDSAGTIWRGQISYPATNKVLVQFNLALAGKAVLT